MKTFSAFALSALLSVSALFAEVQPASSMMAVASAGESDVRLRTNRETIKVPAVVESLPDKPKPLGSHASAIIRVEKNPNIPAAVILTRIALKTHDSVSLELATGSFTTILVTTKVRDDAFYRADPDPNRVVKKQIQRYEKQLKGELP